MILCIAPSLIIIVCIREVKADIYCTFPLKTISHAVLSRGVGSQQRSLESSNLPPSAFISCGLQSSDLGWALYLLQCWFRLIPKLWMQYFTLMLDHEYHVYGVWSKLMEALQHLPKKKNPCYNIPSLLEIMNPLDSGTYFVSVYWGIKCPLLLPSYTSLPDVPVNNKMMCELNSTSQLWVIFVGERTRAMVIIGAREEKMTPICFIHWGEMSHILTERQMPQCFSLPVGVPLGASRVHLNFLIFIHVSLTFFFSFNLRISGDNGWMETL